MSNQFSATPHLPFGTQTLRAPASSFGQTFALAALAVLGVVAGLMAVDSLFALAAALVPAALLCVLLFVRYPRLWLYSGALVNYFWISTGKGDAEITLKEYALVAFFIGGLWIWFFAMTVVKKRRILRTLADKILFIAILAASLTVLLALANDESSALGWLREWLLFWMLLYYFPWREHFTERKHIATFFALTAGVFVGIGAMNLWQYVQAASNVVYAYQIWASRKMLNTHIFLCAVIFCMMGALYAAARKTRILLALLAAFYALVVVVSFSRGFWISGVVGMALTLWLIDKRKLALFALYACCGALAFIVAVNIVFPDKATFIFKVLQARLASSASGTQDLSVLARVYETQAVLDYIARYPLGGAGMGTFIMVYDPLERVFTRVGFIHNGYLYVLMKLGLPFFLAFYAVWFMTIGRAKRLASAPTDASARILAAGALGGLIAFTLLNITSAIPETRDGFYSLSILYAAVAFAEGQTPTPTRQS
jgi:hypothetical protein